MAMQVEWRHDTAANWTSTNPVLANGELVVEYDTGKFKIGDGSTTYNSLSYAGQTGPAQTSPYRSFGDGSDGNVTISSGTTTLSKDMYYNNLTLSSTGQLDVNNFKIFVKGILDLSNAGTGAIRNNGDNGVNGSSGASGGAAGVATTDTSGTMGATNPGSGGAGATGTGANGVAATAVTGNGGGTNSSAAGGAGGTGAGGTAGAGAIPTVLLINRYETNFLRGISLLGGGGSCRGAGGGGGDGTFFGGGGASGGMGGGAVVIYANSILKGTATAAGAIQATGGSGGNGGAGDPAGNTGGGGGSCGGGGGWITIYYNNLFGPIVSNMLDISGGNGGIGGQGTGISAKGGDGGNAGTIFTRNVPLKISFSNTAQNFTSAATWTPQILAGAVINNIPSVGGLGQIYKVNF